MNKYNELRSFRNKIQSDYQVLSLESVLLSDEELGNGLSNYVEFNN